ncbi:endonuclease V [Streptomyces halobius]|uniref:Endonuclease V n=1 Tax=Streptomyces halobius TaxID=2879846 RepID=A0ABY4M345_9ACTN|nr:endonuclease V [Streptomyces halobius]UQA91832.1 endonuclease V [Streptomyces halobius]
MDTSGTISCDDELRHWPTDEARARAVQDRLRPYVCLDESGPELGFEGTVVGVDVAYDDERDVVAAAAVALDARTLAVIDEATAVGRVAFPYVPGLLAFREIPTVLDALGRLARTPDLVVCDGYGRAHPRRFGLASHLGVLTGLPTIGVAKNPFTFRYEPPGPDRGATSSLVDDSGPALSGAPTDGEEVGRALRTQKGVKPVFVSVGHRIDLDGACAHTLRLAPKYRLPETTRAADSLCRRALAGV